MSEGVAADDLRWVYTEPSGPLDLSDARTLLLRLDLSGWSGADSVERVDVGLRAVGSDVEWQPRFQLDQVESAG